MWIRPGWEWPGHEPGQYLRIGVVVDGVHHWRAYSLTSAPGHRDGWISITPKLVEAGKVSPHLVRDARPGSIVRLGGVEGAFVLPARIPGKLLFISAGSGITPIASMLRFLRARDALADAVLLHSARTPQEVIFGAELRELARRHAGFRLHEQHTTDRGRMAPEDLESLCPDWREREAFLSGPARHARRDDRLLGARGRPGAAAHGALPTRHRAARRAARRGRRDRLQRHGRDARASDGSTPILLAGEQAGATLPYGCRMGICHTCVGRLCSGQVRDLRTGKVSGRRGEMVRTCINAPEGDVEIAL